MKHLRFVISVLLTFHFLTIPTKAELVTDAVSAAYIFWGPLSSAAKISAALARLSPYSRDRLVNQVNRVTSSLNKGCGLDLGIHDVKTLGDIWDGSLGDKVVGHFRSMAPCDFSRCLSAIAGDAGAEIILLNTILREVGAPFNTDISRLSELDRAHGYLVEPYDKDVDMDTLHDEYRLVYSGITPKCGSYVGSDKFRAYLQNCIAKNLEEDLSRNGFPVSASVKAIAIKAAKGTCSFDCVIDSVAMTGMNGVANVTYKGRLASDKYTFSQDNLKLKEGLVGNALRGQASDKGQIDFVSNSSGNFNLALTSPRGSRTCTYSGPKKPVVDAWCAPGWTEGKDISSPTHMVIQNHYGEHNTENFGHEIVQGQQWMNLLPRKKLEIILQDAIHSYGGDACPNGPCPIGVFYDGRRINGCQMVTPGPVRPPRLAVWSLEGLGDDACEIPAELVTPGRHVIQYSIPNRAPGRSATCSISFEVMNDSPTPPLSPAPVSSSDTESNSYGACFVKFTKPDGTPVDQIRQGEEVDVNYYMRSGNGTINTASHVLAHSSGNPKLSDGRNLVRPDFAYASVKRFTLDKLGDFYAVVEGNRCLPDLRLPCSKLIRCEAKIKVVGNAVTPPAPSTPTIPPSGYTPPVSPVKPSPVTPTTPALPPRNPALPPVIPVTPIPVKPVSPAPVVPPLTPSVPPSTPVRPPVNPNPVVPPVTPVVPPTTPPPSVTPAPSPIPAPTLPSTPPVTLPPRNPAPAPVACTIQAIASDFSAIAMPVPQGQATRFRVCGIPAGSSLIEIGYAGLGLAPSSLTLPNPNPGGCYITTSITVAAGNYTMGATTKNGAGAITSTCQTPFIVAAPRAAIPSWGIPVGSSGARSPTSAR